MKKRVLLASIVTAFIALITLSGTGMAQSSPADIAREYINKANQFFAAKHYEQAANTLDELLDKEPDLNNEMVFKQLTHIYDDYLFDFEKAVSLYKKYLNRFPEGIFADEFRGRAVYLEDNRSEWPIMQRFRSIQLEDDHMTMQERLKEAEAILSRHEDAEIAPDMHIYLANKYFETARYQEARKHVETYIDSFGKAGISSEDKASALQLYADILVRQHRFGKAIRAVDQAIALNGPDEDFNYALKKNRIIKQRNMLYAFIGSLLYALTVLASLILLRFWRHFHLRSHANQLVGPLQLLALVTLGPMVILMITREPETNIRFFCWLFGLAVIFVIVTRLAAPFFTKFSRAAYMTMSVLHMAAASFIAYYLTIYSGRQTSINALIEIYADPLTTLFKCLMWGSIIAILIINPGFSLLFSKTKTDDSSGGYIR
ncbi:hypothetical protein PghCCS26_26060 [Paenibacillus glycanilyticus]|uniref:Tetratricopeptide repeat protein n=1 Tax=Paenibacillus glycanilyticus TaxID=126569 RepID=A0ABQ6NK49_9BACL|nr:tetratricopeptide repeat protein [Paenibacillus glycanilyticus]GMK45478.1 hypothetical protein PghCCS26_26060 [Paenibacillus glycanilyticus]